VLHLPCEIAYINSIIAAESLKRVVYLYSVNGSSAFIIEYRHRQVAGGIVSRLIKGWQCSIYFSLRACRWVINSLKKFACTHQSGWFGYRDDIFPALLLLCLFVEKYRR
jgi:hypothetical protein